KNVPVLKAVKNKLEQMNSCTLFVNTFSSDICTTLSDTDTEQKIQKVITGMAVKMRSQNQRGCYYIEAINEFIASGAN
ncbi:MAG: glutamyl-tRNA reductase, partial [Ferruginibacter sp.]|nr:glutamyl-tRNA reductase [Ferruginibacter sp.]